MPRLAFFLDGGAPKSQDLAGFPFGFPCLSRASPVNAILVESTGDFVLGFLSHQFSPSKNRHKTRRDFRSENQRNACSLVKLLPVPDLQQPGVADKPKNPAGFT